MPWLVLRMLALKSWLSSRTKRLTTKPVRVGIFALATSLLFYPAPARAGLDVEPILQMAAEWAFSLAAAITKVIVLLIDAMVPIMTYNSFVDNPVVKAGWAIVRDTVNMFFVVIFIIIAFGTIFGAERFKWQQQVPRLLIMAIVVNFSKTLCGIMIDFGQVIMLTFANALREIAAGNFIQLLGLNEIYTISRNSDMITDIETKGGEGASVAFDFFAAGVASVLMVVWVLATLVIMVAILLFRIIMLWVLIVMAPLAWFMKGAKGIIDSKAYEDWWNEFKCLVGIGPVLAFFLWLTLAVAGAGNIAAKSGFTVDANSNNANFVPVLFQLNNFLSFLIGMAMLFAGFKAASQFCSAGIAGGKIGSMLKQPAALARTTAGLGAKAGGVGMRFGGRVVAGTPGALKAGSRYLPPSVRNLPTQMNPLNAQRRAALSGVVGGVFGDTAAGRYFKGKKADLELGVRATKFNGVNKEKEAMKDKSRDWKKGQIDSMLKSRPITQTGQDAMTALFEEVMGDKRLQKELGRDKVQELWKSQGGKYKDMAKGNAAKSADLESFEKANADFTGSSHLINTFEDTKELSDDALANPKIQERLRTIKSNVKGKNGEMLTAYDAISGGHMGEMRKSSLEGSGERFDRMDSAELRGVNTQALGEKGSSQTLQRATEVAAQNGDVERARDLISRIGERYKSEEDPNKKADMLLAMDNLSGTLPKGGMLKHLDQVRNTAESVSPPPPATLGLGESAEPYVERMKGATQKRKENAAGVLNDQETNANAEIEGLAGERSATMAGRTSSIETELQALQKTLADARIQVDAELKKKTNDIQTQWLAAVKDRDEKSKKSQEVANDPKAFQSWKDEATSDASAAAQKAAALQRQLDEARKQTNLPSDRQKSVGADDRVKRIEVEIQVKKGQLENMTPDEQSKLEAIDRRIAELGAHIEQIGKARKGIS